MAPPLFDKNNMPMADTIDEDFISFLPLSEPQATGVVLGLITGEVKSGTMAFFDPRALEISVRPDGKQNSGQPASPVRVARDQVAYIAFRSATPPPPPEKLKAMEQVEVHLAGGKHFQVRAVAETINDDQGFFAWPVDNRSLFREFYFFAHGLAQAEDPTPLGEMLTRQGRVTPSQVEAGLKQQFEARHSSVGEILVEQQAAELEIVEQAAAHQEQLKQENHRPPIRIGDILVASGLISEKDIAKALLEQKKRKGKRLGQVLVEMGLAAEKDISSTLADKFHLPFIDLDEIEPQMQAVADVPTELIERYRVFPYKADRDTLWMAIGDPLQMEALEVIRFGLNKKVREVLATPSQIEQYIAKFFPNLDKQDDSAMSMDDIISRMSAPRRHSITPRHEDLVEVSVDDPVVNQLVNRIIIDAFRQDASDIHIEPYGKTNDAVVRFRVDGVCSTYQMVPAAYSRQVISRIKIMAKLDIAERRKPQDGKIRFKAGKDTIELRVATIPTVGSNEDVVMRILANGEPLPLDKMGFSDYNREQLEKLIQRPYGILLAVGPTGSGKTTTLHSLVGHINDDHRKIWTAEDPVEITQPGLRQVQVQSQIGFTFAAAIRSFLRADPDVILVGEMRDHETASIGVEASLTGHLVLSTLHTNSAAETVTRLIDMGIDPFTFADSLLGVLAQRLARRLCTKCKEQYEASEAEVEEITNFLGEEEMEKLTEDGPLKLWRSCGCDHCKESGFKGRIGIHELLVSSDDIKNAVQHKATASDVADIARKDGMKTLVQDGIQKAIAGHTTIKQVLSVCSR